MDVVASRAKTSKRSLYAHFESKDRLFLAVIDFVRGLFLGRMKTPRDYSDKPTDALVMFCGRYLEILLYETQIRMIRVSTSETERLPEQAAEYFDVLFTLVEERLSAYLKTTFDLSARASAQAAQRLLGQLLYPRFPRALFGLDELAKSFDREVLAPEFDLKPVRKSVADLIESLRK